MLLFISSFPSLSISFSCSLFSLGSLKLFLLFVSRFFSFVVYFLFTLRISCYLPSFLLVPLSVLVSFLSFLLFFLCFSHPLDCSFSFSFPSVGPLLRAHSLVYFLLRTTGTSCWRWTRTRSIFFPFGLGTTRKCSARWR